MNVVCATGPTSYLDTNGSGQLKRDEFVVGCVRSKGERKAIDSECTMREINKLRKEIAIKKNSFQKFVARPTKLDYSL